MTKFGFHYLINLGMSAILLKTLYKKGGYITS